MGQVTALLHSFSTGEVSTSALARVDQERLRVAAEIQENLYPHVIGKGLIRPGTTHILPTPSNNKARYLRFVKSPTDTAMIECSDSLARFIVSDALVTRGAVTSSVTNGSFSTASATITMTQANPCVVTWTAHGRSADDPVSFESTTGVLAGSLVEGTVYYVKTVLTADTFTISATPGGAAIDTSAAAATGTLTGYYGWGVSATTGATATISSGALTLAATARGSSTLAKQAVATSNSGSEHGLRIIISQGSVLFRCGSTDGDDDLITETALGTGEHSLAFTPSGATYYIRFFTRTDLVAKVDSCTVESAGTVTITAPWSEADLPLIRFDQSGDVLFMACTSWGQRKIERRASGRSWSLVNYEPDDGPFVTADTNKVTLTPSVAQGVGTMTASANVFKSTDVGRLIRVFPSGYSASFTLAAADTYSEAVRVFGANTDTDIAFAITGTFTGTLSLQRSWDGADSGFIDVPALSYTVPTTSSYTASGIAGQPFNNVAAWYRFGFKPGDYTSGSAVVQITYKGGGRAGVYRITAYTSATEVEVQTLSPPGSLDATSDWSLGAWSGTSQYPSSVGFFDGRLFWGGLDKFWGSESDNYYAFNLDTEGTAGSIQRAVATGGAVNAIRWMLPLQRLILGTSGAEISVRSSSFDEPLSPTNITLKDASTQGVAALSPVKLDGRGIYVHRDGVRLFELVYDVEGNDYRAASLVTLNEDIGGTGIVALGIQRSPQTYIWAVRADGKIVMLLHDAREKTSAWTKHIAAPSVAGDAVIEDVCVLPSAAQDRVYFVVKRTINGSTVRHLEKLALHSEAIGGTTTIMSDNSITVTGPVTTVSGLTHLVGETVIAWGTVGGVAGPLGAFTVNPSGEITLSAAATNVTVGLEHTWRYKSAKLAYGAKGGTALLQTKRVPQLGLLAENIHPNAVRYGADFNHMYGMPRIEGGKTISETAVQTTYDEMTWSLGDGWDTDSRVCLTGTSRYPGTLNALVVGIETNED